MVYRSDVSDSDLLVLIKTGDQGAFKIIYERYWQLLFVAAFKVLKDEDEAKDVVQEVFTSFLNRGEELVITTSLSSYLYSAVRYKVFDVLSRSKVRTAHEEALSNYIAQGGYQTDRKLIEQEMLIAVEREVQNLPPKMREIFDLSRKQQLSHKEIGKALNISDKTVKKQINNALKILRPKFTNFYVAFSVVLLHFFKQS